MANESVAMSTPEETINAATRNEYQEPTWLKEKIEHAERVGLNRPSPPTIYRVPDSLRELNKEAYTPEVISIGPLHYGSAVNLQFMEDYKLRLLKSFMERTNINKKKLAKIIQDSEVKVRAFYAEAIQIPNDTLKQIILVDASFIIEFFLMRKWPSISCRIDELKAWQISRMRLDLILLENQLPFFIIEKLYMLAFGSPSNYPSSFLQLTFDFFREENVQNISHDKIDSGEIMHFVDLLRHFYLHFSPLLKIPIRSLTVVHEMYSASQLAEAGLKFEPSSSRSLLDLNFDFKKGVLKIPSFTLDYATETYVRNVIAWEQCHYPLETYFTDYFVMLDFLINTGKDVDILVKQLILVNNMGTNGRPLLPGNFCTGISCRHVSIDYYDVCGRLVEFRRKHWYVIHLSSLKQDDFRTPWIAAATVGAIILLVLTLMQTVFTVIGSYSST